MLGALFLVPRGVRGWTQGRYLHPELYGKSLAKRIGAQAQLSGRQHSYPRAGLGR
jgi:hypothetical protein